MGRHVLWVCAVALSGCAATHELTKEVAQQLISPEEEIALGRDVQREVAGQAQTLKDAGVQAYVERVGQRVAAASAGTRALPVRFVVLSAPDQVNAFAIPGGTIYVFSGLLLRAKSEGELAGVLAHEVGHVTERHVAQQLVTQYGLSALTAAALGGNPGVPAQIAASLVQNGLLLKYTRDQEREADRDAVQALAKVGVSADPLANFFQRLAASENTPAFLAFLQTHPAPAERAANVDRLATEMNAHRGEVGVAAIQPIVGQLRRYYAARGAPARM
jgi:predicted Zn-dependent protease